MQWSSRSLASRRCRRRNNVKLPSVVRAKLTSKCHESKSNSVWSDRFFSNSSGGGRLFFEPLSITSLDWNRNLLMVLPNKVFYGNCVVCRISVSSSSQKAEKSCHCNYANGTTAFSLPSLFIYKKSSLVESVFEVKSQAIEESVKHRAERQQDFCIDGNQKSLNDDII